MHKILRALGLAPQVARIRVGKDAVVLDALVVGVRVTALADVETTAQVVVVHGHGDVLISVVLNAQEQVHVKDPAVVLVLMGAVRLVLVAVIQYVQMDAKIHVQVVVIIPIVLEQSLQNKLLCIVNSP